MLIDALVAAQPAAKADARRQALALLVTSGAVTPSQADLLAAVNTRSAINALVASDSGIGLASPKFCFDSNYSQLNGIDGLILAVDKNTLGKWER